MGNSQGRLVHNQRVFLTEALVDVCMVDEVTMDDGVVCTEWSGLVLTRFYYFSFLSSSQFNSFVLPTPPLLSFFLSLRLWHITALAFSLTRPALCRAPSFHCGLHLHNFPAQPDSSKACGCAGRGAHCCVGRAHPLSRFPSHWKLICSLLSLIAWDVCLTLTNLWMLSQKVIAPILNDAN